MKDTLIDFAGFVVVGVLVALFYVTNQPPAPIVLANNNTHVYTEDMVVNDFNKKVAGWSWELKDMPNPYKAGGNCLAVAQEIQKRLRDEGRMALILATDPIPDDGASHAIVLYNSDPQGTLDSVIDNGFVTDNFPRKRAGLYTGQFGKYLGEVDRCVFEQKNLCYIKENSII